MIGRVLRVAAYVKAPVQMFVLRHPVRALKWGATYLAVKTVLDVRRRGGPATAHRRSG